VTRLLQIMLEELERRNYAPSTTRTYIRTVEHFARYFGCPPDRLGTEHIRQYQAAMFRTWKLAPNTVTQRLAALRFLYIQVLNHGWSVAETPCRKKAKTMWARCIEAGNAKHPSDLVRPRCRSYHSYRASGSFARTNAPSKPVTEDIEPPMKSFAESLRMKTHSEHESSS